MHNWLMKQRTDRKHFLLIVGFVLMLAICILRAVSISHSLDFVAINGTFQNYNPVRRLFAGQTPFVDFIDYLGLGHLYLGSLFTMIFGGNYHASLIAFHALSMISFSLLMYTLGCAILRNKSVSIFCTDVMLVVLLVQPLFFTNMLSGTKEILDALNNATHTGNSARYLRGMVLPLMCLSAMGGWTILNRIVGNSSKWAKYKGHVAFCGVGVLLGVCFLWSNDYGISTWLCGLLVCFFVVTARTGSILKGFLSLLIEVVISAVSMVFFATIVTRGNPGAWIESITSTGNYQRWYYNNYKSYFIFDVETSFLPLLQAFFCLYYMFRLCKAGGTLTAIRNYGIPCLIHMTCFCAVNEYKILSGGGSVEMAYAALFITIVFETIHLVIGFMSVERRRQLELIACGLAIAMGLAWIGETARAEWFESIQIHNGTYVSELGGYLYSQGEDLKATDEFLQDSRVFATYASAQEVISGTFQPSGIDYIIHVLGDKTREKYLNAFHNGDFDYAATIQEQYSDWEFWAARANWFFYRDLYRDWHPVYGNSYDLYWARNTESGEHVHSEGIDIEIQKISENSQKIIVHADEAIDGIADVYLDYSVEKQDRGPAKFMISSVLKVSNTGTNYAKNKVYDSNFIRPKGAEYIPINVVNGYGEVTLTAEPVMCTNLVVNEASCEDIFTVMNDYIEVNLAYGLNEQTVLVIDNTERNERKLQTAMGVRIGDVDYSIEEYWTVGGELRVAISATEDLVNKINDGLKKGNVFQVIKD